jgi:hypothetical protein
MPWSCYAKILVLKMTIDANREALLSTIERRSNLAGRFTNMRRVGDSGGDGQFSLLVGADDSVCGERVALKFYHPLKRLDRDTGYRFDCFTREAEILEHLSGEKDIIGWRSPIL